MGKAVYSKPVEITLDSGCKGPCDGSDYIPTVPSNRDPKKLPEGVTVDGEITSKKHLFSVFDICK